MKHIIFLATFSLLLSACTSADLPPSTFTPTGQIPTMAATEIPTLLATAVPSPTEAPKFTFDSVGISATSELGKALAKHRGLEASITLEADGTYSASVMTLGGKDESLPEATITVAPESLQINFGPDTYDNTPFMKTPDGKTVYWIDGKGWMTTEFTPELRKVYVPEAYTEAYIRMARAAFREPFPAAALERWKKTPGLSMDFYYSGGPQDAKIAYLRSRSAMDQDIDYATEGGIQALPAWFYRTIDGDDYDVRLFKVLDPNDQNNPQGNEWKILMGAPGRELLNKDLGYVTTDISEAIKRLTEGKDDAQVVFAVAVGGDFLTNGRYGILATAYVPLPSLDKFFQKVENEDYSVLYDFGILKFPGYGGGFSFLQAIDMAMGQINIETPQFELPTGGVTPEGKSIFLPLPDDAQLVIYPILILSR